VEKKEVKPVEKANPFGKKEEPVKTPVKPEAKTKNDNPFGKKDDDPFAKTAPLKPVKKPSEEKKEGKTIEKANPFGKKEEPVKTPAKPVSKTKNDNPFGKKDDNPF